MTKRFFKSLPIVVFLFTYSFLGYTQITVDTIRSENPEFADTVVIYEEPVVISSKLEVYRPPVRSKKSTLFLSFDIGVGIYYDYNSICDDCIEYTNKIKSSTSKLPSYLYRAQFSLSKKKWVMAISLGSYNQQYKFDYTDIDGKSYTSINKIKTAEGKFSLGYWINKPKKKSMTKISVIPAAAITVGKPYDVSGKLYTQDSAVPIDELNNVLNFNPVLYILGLEAKILYEIKKNIYLCLTPSYNYDLKSIVNREGPFTIQRHMFDLNLGIMVGLK